MPVESSQYVDTARHGHTYGGNDKVYAAHGIYLLMRPFLIALMPSKRCCQLYYH